MIGNGKWKFLLAEIDFKYILTIILGFLDTGKNFYLILRLSLEIKNCAFKTFFSFRLVHTAKRRRLKKDCVPTSPPLLILINKIVSLIVRQQRCAPFFFFVFVFFLVFTTKHTARTFFKRYNSCLLVPEKKFCDRYSFFSRVGEETLCYLI